MRLNARRLHQGTLALILLLCLLCGGFSGMAASPGEILVIEPPAEMRISPEAENWVIPFDIVDTSKNPIDTEVHLKEVRINQKSIDIKKIDLGKGRFNRLPVKAAGKYIPREDLLAWNDLMKRQDQKIILTAREQSRRQQLNQAVIQKVSTVPELNTSVNEVIIPARSFSLQENQSYEVEVIFEIPEQEEQLNFTTTVKVVSLPNPTTDNGQWLPGDLHIHSTYSDGNKSVADVRDMMKDRGYRFVYLTDGHHTGKLLAPGWNSYMNAVAAVSQQDSVTSIFPGMETTVGVGKHEGHMTAYGLSSIDGLEDKTISPQQGIDIVAARNPEAPSSSSVAHATNPFLPWKDYTVIGHTGMELMMLWPGAGRDLDAALVKNWRSEVARHLDNAITGTGTFPSARTGTDFHGSIISPSPEPYVTWVYSAKNWDGDPPLDHYQRKATIDLGLHNGHTIASFQGSFALMTLDGKIPGSIIRNVPANSVLPISLEFQSARNGNYRLRVFRNNVQETVFERSCGGVKAGDCLRWQGEITFPGGNQYYWLYLEHISGDSEYVYTSPIFVTSLGAAAPSISAPAEWTNAAAVPVSIMPGSNAAFTEYRLEGATVQDWTEYSSAFQITAEGETVITARSIDAYGGVSPEVAATVKIDRSPPIIEINAATDDEEAYRDGSWTKYPVTVAADFSDSFSGIDAASIKYALNDGSLMPYTEPIRVADEGEHLLHFQASDRIGNTRELSFAVKIDKKPPLNPTLQVSPTGWSSGEVTFTLTAQPDQDGGSGIAKMCYRYGDSEEWIDYEGPVTVSAEGEVIVYGRSFDYAGNYSGTTSAWIGIDRTPPQVQVTVSQADGSDYEAGSWSRQQVKVTADFSDSLSGISATEQMYSSDGGETWRYYTGPLWLDDDGIHNLTFKGTDNVGNITVTEPVTVKVDLNPPAAPQILVSPEGWTNKEITLTLIPGKDLGSGPEKSQYRIGETGTWVDYEETVTLSEEVNAIVYARTFDRVGWVSASSSAWVQLDLTAPRVSISAQKENGEPYEPGSCSDQPILISAEFEDPFGEMVDDTRLYSLDGGVHWQSYNGGTVKLEDEGRYTVIFKVEDKAGNEGRSSLEATIRFTVPVSGVTVEPDSLLLFLGEEAAVTAIVEPADATDRSLLWSSSKPGIATVDEAGVVTAHAPGEAVITVQTKDGGFSASIEVQVALPGDVDMSQKVDVGDGITVLREIVGALEGSLNSTQRVIADVNRDGVVDVGDAIYILRMIVGMIEA